MFKGIRSPIGMSEVGNNWFRILSNLGYNTF
jgi:hypothetical protein